MLNFIDISSWQAGIKLASIACDGVIVKATEGTSYVNPYCNQHVEDAKANGKLWGFYHYAKAGYAETEADFFINNCKNYFGNGIPVLDWEESQSVVWVNAFVNRIHEKTGVWPWIYANPWRFNQGNVEKNCMRWVAAYPNSLYHPNFSVDEGEPPLTDGGVGAWQFASDGRLDGYSGDLDINRFYGDKKAWLLYAGAKEAVKPVVNDSGKSEILENDTYRITIERK